MTHLKSLFFILVMILSGYGVFAQNKADLTVTKIEQPVWTDTDSTMIVVEVKNIGSAVSEPGNLKIWDLDISVKEAKKIGVSRRDLWIFEENNEYSEDGSFDYDENWEKNIEIPSLKSNETYRVAIYLQHWVYDPNCEIGTFIDSGDVVKESDEENNKLYFYEGG